MNTVKPEDTYESFVSQFRNVSFMQSKKWSLVKEGWQSDRLVLKDKEGNVKGAVQLLVKKIPYLRTNFVYAPRGPVCDPHDKETLAKLTDMMKDYAKKKKAFVFRVDPMIPHDDTEAVEILKSLGYSYDVNRSEDYMIQSLKNYVLRINGRTEQEVFDSFHQRWRYKIRTAIKKGVRCEYENTSLDDFYPLMVETGERDHFNIRSKEYYKKLLDAFGDDARLYICYAPDGTPLSGAVVVRYGDRVSYVYGASTVNQRNLMPNYLMQWNMIQWAIESGCTIYDFMGVPHCEDESHPNYGVYRFKKGFNGGVEQYAGEFDYVLSGFKRKLVRFLLGLKGYRKI